MKGAFEDKDESGSAAEMGKAVGAVKAVTDAWQSPLTKSSLSRSPHRLPQKCSAAASRQPEQVKRKTNRLISVFLFVCLFVFQNVQVAEEMEPLVSHGHTSR